MIKKRVIPLWNPPSKLRFRKIRDPLEVCDLQMTIDEFALLCSQAQSNDFEHQILKTSKPLNKVFQKVSNNETCLSCHMPFENSGSRKKKVHCKRCNLVYLRSSKRAKTEVSKVKCMIQKYICVTDGDAKLIIPPVNYYPGDLAKDVVVNVRELLKAQKHNSLVYFDVKSKRFHRYQEILTNCKNDKPFSKSKLKLVDPQTAVTQLNVLCSNYSTRLKCGKANEFRRLCYGRVMRNCARLTIGTNGALKAGEITLPSEVLANVGVGNSYLAIRYPVLGKGSITFAKAYSGGIRSTADVPSSQCKYNGADNDGDQFNFIRCFDGLLANSARSLEALLAPWHNIGNSDEIKVEFDSDAKMGLGKSWKNHLKYLIEYYTLTNDSRGTYERFCQLEKYGREKSASVGIFSLDNLVRKSSVTDNLELNNGIRRMIHSEAISRFNESHLLQATSSIGFVDFEYNRSPVKRQIKSSFVSGLTSTEFIASCQSSVDTIASQNSTQISVQGNLQYQCQFVMRPMILAYDRQTVYNPVTQKTVSPNVCNIYAIFEPLTPKKTIAKAALFFAFAALKELYLDSFVENEITRQKIRLEAIQYRKLVLKLYSNEVLD